MMRPLTLLLFILSLAGPAGAAITAYEFDDPTDEERFRRLTDEFRCLVCQNQSIADSNAGLARDLKRETHRMIREGKTDREIIDFMVERYGEFVLYRPPVKPGTIALWAGPPLLLAGGAAALVIFIRRRGRASDATELSEAERARLERLVGHEEEQSR
jgi:cytochrome c-type biogenesis protein CcmH